MKYIQYIGIDLKLFTLLYTDGTVDENSLFSTRSIMEKKTWNSEAGYIRILDYYKMETKTIGKIQS